MIGAAKMMFKSNASGPTPPSPGALFAWGYNNYGMLGQGDSGVNRSSPVPVGAGTDWTALKCGSSMVYALRAGALFTWGYNGNGELGNGTRTDLSSPVQVGADADWTAVGGLVANAAGIRGG
jgi:alpha-tubulin suppressor-like RCC1 family protein